MRILATTDFSTRSHRASRRAGLLAQTRGAELALVHVVDDDHPKDLVEIERREAERILAEQIGAMSELRDAKCRPMVVAGDPFDGILRTAESDQGRSHRHGRAPQAATTRHLRRDNNRAGDPYRTVPGAYGEQRSEANLRKARGSRRYVRAVGECDQGCQVSGTHRGYEHYAYPRVLAAGEEQDVCRRDRSSCHRRVCCQ